MQIRNVENPERRKFLRAVPVAAAAGLVLTDASVFGMRAAAQHSANGGESYEKISAGTLQDDIGSQQANGGNKTLYRSRNFSIVLTTEKAASGKEFEWHEHRDHIFYVLDGETTFELGGKPQNAHSPRPGEWLAPSSQSATKVTLRKGDTLVIPRGTPHKRSTPVSATFTLTAPMTPVNG